MTYEQIFANWKALQQWELLAHTASWARVHVLAEVYQQNYSLLQKAAQTEYGYRNPWWDFRPWHKRFRAVSKKAVSR